MMLSPEDIDFIEKNINADAARLLLSASKYSQLNVPFLVEQILSRRQIKEKLPLWFENPNLVFPAKITAEQCSSEQTALYKQRFISSTDKVCDLTGGLGIDSFYLSQKAQHLTYIERFPLYCEAARNNFEFLGAQNITVVNADSSSFVGGMGEIDLFYIDPARRGDCNKRVFALQDCEPDLPALLPLLFNKAPRVLAKISPMADIQMSLDLLPETTSVHILSVKNECKELLFLMERGKKIESPEIVCVNFSTGGEKIFRFTLSEEKSSSISYANEMGKYLYEPNSSILKAGAFKQVGLQFNLTKLHVSSHLYTSDSLIEDFPGRSFEIEEIIPFSGKQLKQLNRQIPKANITTRNFPLSVEELRKRLKITDGGDCYIFATTLSNDEKVLLKCKKENIKV